MAHGDDGEGSEHPKDRPADSSGHRQRGESGISAGEGEPERDFRVVDEEDDVGEQLSAADGGVPDYEWWGEEGAKEGVPGGDGLDGAGEGGGDAAGDGDGERVGIGDCRHVGGVVGGRMGGYPDLGSVWEWCKWEGEVRKTKGKRKRKSGKRYHRRGGSSVQCYSMPGRA